jgi:hypothetical protein
MTSTLSLMNVSICEICTLTSLLLSAALRVTSSNSAACALAFLAIAAIQPWSAAGARKPMVTFGPSSALPPSPPLPTTALASPSSSLFPVQPVRTAPAPTAAPPSRKRRRPRPWGREVGMVVSFEGDAG